jgi:hypothetical protein
LVHQVPAIPGKVDESLRRCPVCCRIGRISPFSGDATLLGSRLASSVSSTLDVADGNNPKTPVWQGQARSARVTSESLFMESMLRTSIGDLAA